MTFADTVDPAEISTGVPNQRQLKVERCCEEFRAASSKRLEPNFETRDQPARKIQTPPLSPSQFKVHAIVCIGPLRGHYSNSNEAIPAFNCLLHFIFCKREIKVLFPRASFLFPRD